MRTEDAVPIIQCYLVVEAHVAPHLVRRIAELLAPPIAATTVCCFLGFAYADLPLGTRFDRVFAREDFRRSTRTLCVVSAVTQQFFKPFDEIPHGWKTICFLDFPEGIPDLIARLPVAEGWYETAEESHVLLSTDATWVALIKGAAL